MFDRETVKILGDCENFGDKIIVKSDLHSVIETVITKYGFDMLKSITAVDKKEEGVELIYLLYSTENDEDLKISVTVKDEAETVTDLFQSAIADENEIYDLFGIKFSGNKNLKRLYMPEDWEGFPLRKDYIESDTRLAWNDDNDTQT